ncbi:carbonic anhydrase [Anopheles sinensis]|uniref:Carbonic anhydrase n=1 Tax=Anopheles sinensis TaxID=74873 RepID=A0A084VX56_ANOSI|nr:carbonic anhydrase [Anopheles sinensis]
MVPNAVQSPVCLSKSLSRMVDDAIPLRFARYFDDYHGGKAKLTNDGQTAVLTLGLQPALQPCIAGGPLDGVYLFEQLHFHWGPNDSHGSEHLIEGVAHAMEIHLVHYNAKYGSFRKAMERSDGLAVVAFLVHARGTVDCEDFLRITRELQHIVLPGSTRHAPADCMRWLAAQDLDRHYFSYRGTLTTAPFFASVTWIVYAAPVYVSHNQTAAFRMLRTFAGHCATEPASATRRIESNFRPVQPSEPAVTFARNTRRRMQAKL